ncbi:MAG: DsrE family protein [Gemmatimonadota bacterium]|nr:DsrE family protein [Gemmatimonadota bacterium]
MKTLFILNDPPYGTERSYNALRLAAALAKKGTDELRVFLMGDAAACAKKGQSVAQGFYNINRMLQVLAQCTVPISACGTCMDARGIAADELLDGSKRGTLDELAGWTAWAEKVVVF